MAARADILEKVKKSRQEAERRIQESNKQAEQARQESQRAYQQNTSKETQKAASYMKQYNSPSKAGNTVADYAQKRKQLTSWYKGPKPTEVETLAKIVQETEKDRAFGERLYGLYEKALAEGEWSETYDKATSRYAQALGLPEGAEINDAFFEAMAPYFDAGVTTDAGNLSTAKKNGADALVAANLAGLYDDYQKTKVLQDEEAQAMKEAQYWIAKGLTDEEIIQKLNIGGENSKYKQLTAALNKTKTGEYEPTTAPIQLLTSYGVQGMLYGLRNPNDASGDYKMDAVKSQMGRGVQYISTPDEIARRTPGSNSWAPYSNGTTMDDEAIILGTGPNVSPEWFDRERNRIFATGTDDEKKAFASMWAAEETMKRVESEYADLLAESSKLLSDVSSYENAEDLIKQLFYDADGNVKYKELAKLDESLLSGQIVALTRGTDYDYKSFTQEITRQFNIKKANEDAAKNPEALATAVENEKEALIRKNGTVYDKSTLPKSQTNEVVSVFDEPSADILTEGLMWASTTIPSSRPKNDTRFDDTRPIYELMAGQYAGWSDEQKEAADDYIYSTENGYDLSEPIEAMRSAGLSDEEINSFRSQVSEAISTQGYKSEYAFDWFEPAEVANTGVDNQQAIWAAIGDGDYLTAAELQYQNIAGLMENSDDPAITEIVHSAGSQKAAATLMTMVVEGRLPEQIADPKVKEQLQQFEKYALKALGVDQGVLAQAIYKLDGLLNMGGTLIDANENDGLGLNTTLMLVWEAAMSKGAGFVDDLIGQALVTVGSIFGNEKIAEKGNQIAAVEDRRQAHYNQVLEKNGTPLEILAGRFGAEGVHMAQLGYIAGGIMNFAKAKLGDTLKFITRMAGSLPFAAEAGTSEFHEAYAETRNAIVSSVASLASFGVTTLMSNWDGVLKNIEAKGLPYIPEVVEKLSAVPSAGFTAGFGRWGKSFALWLGNMAKTAVNEALQEPAESAATTFLTDLIKGENPFDKDWKTYGKELISEGVGAAIISLAGSVPTMSAYARSVKVAEAQFGQSELTAADVETFVNALKEDMADPQIVSEMQERAEAIVVEARTGELVSEGALPEVDNSAVVAAEKAVQEKTEAAAQATAEKDAAYAKFRENPADDAATSLLTAAIKQEQKAVKDAQDAQAELAEAQASVQAQSEAAMEATRAQARSEVEQAINAVAAEKEKEAEPAPSSYIDSYFDPSEHTQEEIEIANEYKAAVDPTLLEAAKQYRENGKLEAPFVDLGPVTAKERNAIEAQTGVDTTGYIHAVNNDFFAHLESRHGLNGQENRSMADLNDVARAEWVIQNADKVELLRKNDGSPDTTKAFKDRYNHEDKLVRFSKKIDGSVYVVEAVGENKRQKLWLLSSYIQKKSSENNSQNTMPQPVPDGVHTPEPNVRNEPSAGNFIISNADENVNANTGVSQFAAQTGQNTPVLSDAVKEELRNSPYYQKTSQKGNVDKAIAAIDAEGYEIRKNKLLDGTTNLYTPEGQAEAYVLARAAKEAGDANGESSIAFKIKESGTLLGQSLAMRQLYVEMTPEGKQQFIQRIVDQINQGYANRNKEIRVAAPDWLADRLKQAGDDKAAVEKVYDDSYAFIAEQMPPDWKTRFDAWRYTAMLANPRTHIRNILGNALFVPAVSVKNKIGALGEYALPKDQRTKSLGLIKKEYKDFAKTQIDIVQDALLGDGKHTPQSEIQKKRRNFNNGVLEWLSKGNGKVLDKEDSWFLNAHFTNALAGFLQARGANLSNVDSATLHEGLDYAINEAQKATYRDASVVADKLSKFTRDLSNSKSRGARAAGLLVEGTLPFKKTPINVMRRGIEYSPVGLANALSFGLHDLKTGKINANEFVDRIASGVTGTGLALIGAMLYNLGALKLSLDEPEDELDKLQGSQEYSVELGGYSYTIDWLSPSAMPLFVGGAIAELFSEGLEEVNLDTIGEALMNIAEPVFNLSMLDGVNSLLSAASYSENGVADVAMRAAESYATQFVPTVFGSFARLFDKTRRTTYTDKNSGVPSSIQYLFDSTVNKIPGASTTGQPYLDAWGDEDVTEQWWIRALENFVSPGYINKLDTDGVEGKLAELFDLTGETGLLPETPQKYFTVGGKRIDLTGEQYEQLTKERGQTAKKLHEELFANSEFLALPAEYQASALQDVWTYSTTLAKSHIDSGVTVAAWISSTSDPAETIMERAAEKQKSDQKDQFKNEMYSAIDGGDSENAATCVAGLIEMGTTAKSLKTSVTNKYKQVYKNMYADGDIAGMRELEDRLILLNIGYRKSEFDGWLN